MKLIFIFALSWLCINARNNDDSNSIEGKIVGGHLVHISRFPHQVAMLIFGKVICGGSLISKKWVVTAAHCLTGLTPGLLQIRLGSNDYTRGGQLVAVSQISIHPKFNTADIDNDYDIALVHLSRTARVGRPIELTDAPPTDGQPLWITGWGAQFTTGRGSQLLRGTVVHAIGLKDCRTKYAYSYNLISNRMLCAAAPRSDTCQGDSGGPLFAKKLYGVTSWGGICGLSIQPGVYTNIANPEIRNYIRTNSGI